MTFPRQSLHSFISKKWGGSGVVEPKVPSSSVLTFYGSVMKTDTRLRAWLCANHFLYVEFPLSISMKSDPSLQCHCLSQLWGQEDEMVGWHHWLNGQEFEQTPGAGEGQGSLVCCSPWACKESEMTQWLNNSSLCTRLIKFFGEKKNLESLFAVGPAGFWNIWLLLTNSLLAN